MLKFIGRIVSVAALILCASLPAIAQCSYTTVSATVSDPNGVPYSFANVSADLVPSPPGGAVCTGNISFPGHMGPIQSDSNGTFTMLVPANAAITPSGTQWKFSVNISPAVPYPFGKGPQAISVTVTVAGDSQSITSQLNAAAPALTITCCGGSGTNILPLSNTFTGASNTFQNAVSIGSLAVVANATVGGTLGVTGTSMLGNLTVGSINGGLWVSPSTFTQAYLNSNTASGSQTFFAAPGTYTYSALFQLADNGNCSNIQGAGMEVTTFVVTASAAAVIGKGTGSNPEGCFIRDIGVNGSNATTAGIQLLRGNIWDVEHIKIDNVANGGEGLQTGQASQCGTVPNLSTCFYEALIDDINCPFTTAEYPTQANTPLSCVHNYAQGTDQTIRKILSRNTLNAALVNDGTAVFISNSVHGFGSPPGNTYMPKYDIDTAGQTSIDQCEVDGAMIAGINVRGNLVSITNCQIQWPSGGAVSGAYAVQVQSGENFLTVTGNRFIGLAANGVTRGVNFLGTRGQNTFVWGNTPDLDESYYDTDVITFAQPTGHNQGFTLDLDSLSSAYAAQIKFSDGPYGSVTDRWTVGTQGGTQAFQIVDVVNNFVKQEIDAGGHIYLNAGSGVNNSLDLNSFTGSGQGGLNIWSGGGTPAITFSVSGSGSAVAENGLTTDSPTGATDARVQFSVGGTNEWKLDIPAGSGSLELRDIVNNVPRMQFFGTTTNILSGSGSLVTVNSGGGGNGGLSVSDGTTNLYGRITANGFETGLHLDQVTGANSIAGIITVTGATSASVTFNNPFNNSPICVPNPRGDPTADGAVWLTSTNTTVTANLHTSGSIAVNYICVGNPN